MGGFVVGDQSAVAGCAGDVLGRAVVEAQLAVAAVGCTGSFKGFGDGTTARRRACGGSFTAGPGNSASFGGQLPSYMGVIVAGSITKHGSAISGNIAHIVGRADQPRLAPNPGHAGTGTEVAVFC